MKKAVVGILAHVDAGKTTLSESLLFKTGAIRNPGRVDHKDTFLDTYALEKERGITVFSKQAQISTEKIAITLLDTPGHVDFSAEAERALSVIDYAVLVINASDAVQGHTETLWKLLKLHKIPVFIFVNKMDLDSADKNFVMSELKKYIHENAVDFTDDTSEEFYEEAAVCDEKILEKYTETGSLSTDDISGLIADQKIIPCYFGSALKITGIDEFIEGLEKYIISKEYGSRFGAKIYKIGHDAAGCRLTYMKITGGSIRVRDMLDADGTDEKINQIRIYSGSRFETVDHAEAGTLCAVTGPQKTYAGQGLGIDHCSYSPVLRPVLNYKIILPDSCNANDAIGKLKILEEEDPQLHIMWNEKHQEINVCIMGEIQLEILKRLISDRFGFDVEFGKGNILYKETIADKVEGVGHYEPLKHYAEVHFIMEPSDSDGIIFDSVCSEDVLDKNWQRLIMTHVFEKQHTGVLTGSPVSGIKITLASGKAHIKHTEGGDFRQACYRAIRNGLRKAKSILLEPYYDFRLEIPSVYTGRAMTDIKQRSGTFSDPEILYDTTILTGEIPVSTAQGYITEVNSYTKGKGKFFCTPNGYKPCHNSSEVIKNTGYDADSDVENTADSVFCCHGSGFIVKWYEADKYMHLESALQKPSEAETAYKIQAEKKLHQNPAEYEKELEEIFEREFGKGKNKNSRSSPASEHGKGFDTLDDYVFNEKKQKEECLLVDGYNIIFSWEELSRIALENFDAARNRLIDILSNYQAYRKCILIVVFDAYKVKGGKGSVMRCNNIYVVFTKEAETADMYIEKTTHNLADKYKIRVATSDALEQMIILGRGAFRISSREFEHEVKSVASAIRKDCIEKSNKSKNYLMDHMDKIIKK